MKKLMMATAALGTLFVTTPARANIVVNGNFASPPLGPNNYAYETFGSSTPATVENWTYATYAGVSNGDGFQNSLPSGTQAGFAQYYFGSISSISQSVSLAAGTYVLSFSEMSRIGFGDATFTASVDQGILNGVATASSVGSYATYTTTFTVGTAGTFSLTLATVGGVGGPSGNHDYTTFFTNVNLVNAAVVPEPASIAMLSLGLIASAGFAARKARRGRA